MARDNHAAYERRNEGAQLAGWASYGEQRRAKALGYATPGEYRAARAGRGRAATPPNPVAPKRTLRGGGEVGSMPGGRVGIVVPWDREAIDGREDRRGVRRGGVWQDLNRYGKARRVFVWAGSAQIGSKHGFSLRFFLDMADEHGSLFDWLKSLLGDSYDVEGEPDTVSFTVR